MCVYPYAHMRASNWWQDTWESDSRRPRHPGPQRPRGRRPKKAAKCGKSPCTNIEHLVVVVGVGGGGGGGGCGWLWVVVCGCVWLCYCCIGCVVGCVGCVVGCEKAGDVTANLSFTPIPTMMPSILGLPRNRGNTA